MKDHTMNEGSPMEGSLIEPDLDDKGFDKRRILKVRILTENNHIGIPIGIPSNWDDIEKMYRNNFYNEIHIVNEPELSKQLEEQREIK